MKISKKIDDIAETVDRYINENKIKVGLTIHFSTTENKWWAAYGKTANAKHRMYGETAEEALRKLSEKMNEPA